jgi:hypothetical protein
MQTLFVVLQSILLVLCLIQDTVNLAPLNNLAAQIKHIGWKKLILGTLLMSGLLACSLYLTLKYAGAPLPLGAKLFLVLWWGLPMLGMYMAWYKPYFFGPTPKELETYQQYFSGTHTLLPPRHGYPGPNTLHLILHAFMIPCAVLGFLKVAGVF